MGRRRAIVVGCGLAGLVACGAFHGVDDTSDAPAGEGGAIACFSCDGAPDCQSFGPTALCNDAGPFTIDNENNNPAPTCRADVLEMTSPTTLDASVHASFAVDGIPSVTVGVRASIRGLGTMMRVADFELVAQDGPADDVVFAFCREQQCQPLFTTKETDATMRSWVMTLDFPEGGTGTVLNARVDCGTPVTLTSPNRSSPLEVAVGPINTSASTIVDIEAVRIVRPRR